MIKLTLHDGRPIWINPIAVTAVYPTASRFGAVPLGKTIVDLVSNTDGSVMVMEDKEVVLALIGEPAP